MRQITYISTARSDVNDLDFRAIETIAQRRNAIEGLSGLLLFDGCRFLQVLEGPEDAVEATIARIAQDPRHYGMVKLKDVTVDHTSFGGWAMLCRALNGDHNVIDLLGPLIREADRSTRALFESFAEIRSKAA